MNELNQKIADAIYRAYDKNEDLYLRLGGCATVETIRWQQREIVVAMVKELAEAIVAEVARQAVEKIVEQLQAKPHDKYAGVPEYCQRGWKPK